MKLLPVALWPRHSKAAWVVFFNVVAITCAFAILLSTCVNQKSNAQEQDSSRNKPNKAELHQALLDLTNPWTVMCVAAHPDDEDGTTLTVLRRKHGVHTVSLFSTYGEGGQNAVGPELYEELGVIRAREAMEAAKIQGSEPHFLGLQDFGFSKSAEETFRIWGHDEALRRMVLKIRELRPDVIITNHDTTGGHGHHQATGRLILEAFDAAADPRRFPEQLSKIGAWQPLRLFVRARTQSGGSNSVAGEGQRVERFVTIDSNERDPVRGTIYAEQALAALQKHATQGPWPKTIAERLRAQGTTTGRLPLIRYRLVREAHNAPALSIEARNFLDGLTLNETVTARLAPPAIEGRPLTDFMDRPDRVLNALIDWRRRRPPTSPASAATDQNIHRVRLLGKRGDKALAIASGMILTVTSPSAVALVPGVLANFSVNLSNTGDRIVQMNRLSFDSWGESVSLEAAEQLNADTETTKTVDRVTPKTAPITVPRSDHLYDGLLFGPRFAVNADLAIDGARFSMRAETNLDVAPAVEIKTILPSPYVWTPALIRRPLSLTIKLTNNLKAPFRGIAKVHGPQYRIFEVGRTITLEPTETRELTIQSNALPVEPSNRRSPKRAGSGQLLISVEAADSNKPISGRLLRVVRSDARVAKGIRVGYLPSFDKTLELSLSALGVAANELQINEIQRGELTAYDTIIIDNRGYQVHPELIEANPNLLTYVQQGGTLIVFYQKDSEWNPNPDKNRPQLAPYPLILGEERVTEETAPVRFLQPRHPLLNFPNRITRSDFDNWIQERGLYYPKEWDPHYSAPFASSDKGEPQLRGGLLVAPYGRGHYIYTSMVWYRQLTAGVPGGYRMFANLISYGHSDKERPAQLH